MFFGERSKDLGTLSGRLINEKSIAFGSHIEWVKYVQQSDPDNEVGIIIANVGESIWCRQKSEAITYERWLALPRDSASGPAFQWIPELNEIYRNENPEAHIRCVFEDVLVSLTKIRHVSINIVSACMTTHALIRFLEKDWNIWKHNIAGVVGTGSFVFKGSDTFQNDEFYDFWRRRCRIYTIDSSKPPNWISREEDVSCLTLTSGKDVVQTEDVMSYVHPYVIDYFKLLSREPKYDNTNEVPGKVLPMSVEPELNTWGNAISLEQESPVTGTADETASGPVPVEQIEQARSEMGDSAFLSTINEATERDSMSIRTVKASHSGNGAFATISPIVEDSSSEIDDEGDRRDPSGMRGGFQPNVQMSGAQGDGAIGQKHTLGSSINTNTIVRDGYTQYDKTVSQGSSAPNGSSTDGSTRYEVYPHGLTVQPSVADSDASSIHSTVSSQRTIAVDSAIYQPSISTAGLGTDGDQHGTPQHQQSHHFRKSHLGNSDGTIGKEFSTLAASSSANADPQDPHAPGGKLYYRGPDWQELQEEAANTQQIDWLSEGERPPSPWTRDIHTDVPGNLYDNEDEEESPEKKQELENSTYQSPPDGGDSLPSPVPLPLFHPNASAATLCTTSGTDGIGTSDHVVIGERSFSSLSRSSPVVPATSYNGSGYFDLDGTAPTPPTTAASYSSALDSPRSPTTSQDEVHVPSHPGAPFNSVFGLKPGSPAHDSMEEMNAAVDDALSYTQTSGGKQRRGAIAAASGGITLETNISEDGSSNGGFATTPAQLKELRGVDKFYKSGRIMDYLDDCEKEGIKKEAGGEPMGNSGAVGAAAGKSTISVATTTTGGSINSKNTEKAASCSTGDSTGTDKSWMKLKGNKAEKNDKAKEKGNPGSRFNRLLDSFSELFTKSDS